MTKRSAVPVTITLDGDESRRSTTIEIPAAGMNAYAYRGFSIVVFASGIAHVTHAKAIEPRQSTLVQECRDAQAAVAWINAYMD